MANTELEQAVKDLEEEVTKSEEKKEEPTAGLLAKAVEILSKAMASVLHKSESKAGEDKTEQSTGAETLNKSIADSEQGKVIDGEEVLKTFQDAIGKSLTAVEQSVNAQVAQVQELVGEVVVAMNALCKSQLALHKMIEASPRSTPMLGLTQQNGKGRDEETPARKGGASLHEEAALGIEKAVHEGKLEPHFLGNFNSRAEQTLRLIPEEVAKSYNIPRTLKQAA